MFLIMFCIFKAIAMGQTIEIDNAVIGEPSIKCSEAGISIELFTRNPFLGRIFVKGESHKPECVVNVRNLQATTRPNLVLPFDRCGMFRRRSTNPKGLYYSATLVVSFHPTFITKVDKAYLIQCFYAEQEKTVSAELEVSMLPTETFQSGTVMPDCRYTVHHERVGGPIARFARIGDKVVHQWECDTDAFGILVKNCFVGDGRGNRIEVIDARGCAIDRVLVDVVEYDPRSARAFAGSHVFKFADLPNLYFDCQLQLCAKDQEGCSRLTPPNCNFPLTPVTPSRIRRTIAETPIADPELDVDLPIGELFVFDVSDPVGDGFYNMSISEPDLTQPDFLACSNSYLGILMAAIGLMFCLLITTAIIFRMILIRNTKILE